MIWCGGFSFLGDGTASVSYTHLETEEEGTAPEQQPETEENQEEPAKEPEQPVSEPEEPGIAGDFVLEVKQGAKTIHQTSLSWQALLDLPQQRLVYTSMDVDGTPEKTWAEGILLTDLLKLVDVNAEDVKNFRIYSSEGWDRSFTYHFLYGVERYTYPNLVSAFAGEKMDQASVGAELIQPILVLRSASQLMPEEDAWQEMDTKQGLRICYGPVSYTHLDVYKRQPFRSGKS